MPSAADIAIPGAKPPMRYIERTPPASERGGEPGTSDLLVSGIKHVEDQGILWPWVGDRTIDRPAQVRNYCGEFFEEASRILFRAQRHQTDGRATVCPDLSVGPKRYLEVKSIGRTRQGLVYAARLEKDRRLVDSGAQLTYVFWLHSVPAQAFTTLIQLRCALARGVDQVLCIPFERLEAACRRLTPKVMNYRNATVTKAAQPMPGYRLPMKLLHHLARGPVQLERTVGKVFGHGMPPILLSGPDLGRVFPALTESERMTAAEMRQELRHCFLDVVPTPAPRPQHIGHCVRTVQNTNPEWYSALCREYPKKRSRPRQRRAFDSDIRRPFVCRALERLASGLCRFDYDFRLRAVVEQHAPPF